MKQQTGAKDKLEMLIAEASKQQCSINELLEHPQKNKLIRKYNETIHDIRGILVKQDNLKVSEKIDGEEIDNHFIPKYTSHV
mmetsp:Transcript_700/g.816  ORF Transcript_700/g.816 Transcript_700/m.816 type:complete len:82 (+) Transcript_700:718-963(+)